MKLRCNSSFRVVRIEILLNPGDEIEVPDEIGARLTRAYESRLVEVTAKTPKQKKSALERAREEGQEAEEAAAKAQETADAEATAEPPKRTRRKSTAKRSTAKRSTAKRSTVKRATAAKKKTAPVGDAASIKEPKGDPTEAKE